MLQRVLSLLFPPSARAAHARTARPADLAAYASPHPFSDTYPSLAVFSYNVRPVRALLHELKFGRNRATAPILGAVLADALLEELGDRALFSGVDSATIIPMPLAPDRYRERGFNQSTLIARATLEQIDVTPIGCNENAVIRASSAPQTRLGTRAEREQNVSGVFTLARPETIEDRHVIILDDIVTTGASMNALAACIAAGRPRSLLCVAVAHTPLGRDRHV